MKPGQKVVCIDDAAPWHLRNHFTTWIKKDRIYVIRGIFTGPGMKGDGGGVGLYLAGIRNPFSNLPPYPERGYSAARFRLIPERRAKTSREVEIEETVEA